MKICHVCRTTYDDSQNFCLNDGTPLSSVAQEEPRQVEPLEPATVVQSDEPATVVHASPTTNLSGRATDYGQTVPPPLIPTIAPVVLKRKSNVGKIVVLTALATVLLVTIAGAGIYLAMRNRNQNIAQVNVSENKNTAKPKNINANLSSANVAIVNANVVEANQNANLANTNLNANILNANVLPSPHPSLKPEQAVKVKKEVSDTLDGWKDATDDRNLDAHMSFYGENVDYYNGGVVNVNKVRSDRQKAFDAYNNIEVELSNVSVTPDATGEKATVILDKAWHFENDEKTSDGKVQQRLMMEKNAGRWYITGEKDLKVYYKNNY